MGKVPCVEADGSCKVSVVTGQDRKVRVAIGKMAGKGTFWDLDVAQDVTMTATVGSPVWWTICRRVNWAPGGGVPGTCSIVAVKGNTTQALAAGLLNDPGVQWDQPLALCRVVAGQQVPDSLVDLRVTLPQVVSGWRDWQVLSLGSDSNLGYPSFGLSPRYRLSIDLGTVQLEGTIQRNTDYGHLDGNTIFQLPTSGLFPANPASKRYRVIGSERRGPAVLGGTPVSPGSIINDEAYTMRLEILSSGEGVVIGSYHPAWVNLGGVEFVRN
jgi:hypothetical protein